MTYQTRERRAVVGTIAMAVVNAAKLGLQLMVLPILARILDPSSFGLVALAMPFVMVTAMICDLGLGNAIVRQRETSRELESTIFWMALLIASCLALLVCVLAWPVSRILSEPRLPPILMAMSLLLLFGGGLSVVNARIARERRFSIFAVGEIMASLLSSAAAIGAALAGLGAWSLVVQQLTIWGVKAIWLVPQSGFRLGFFCNPRLARPFLRFGLNAAGSSVADLAAKSVPPLIVGGLLGVTVLGHYSMAYQIVRVPEMIVSGPLFLSIFTAVARCGDNRSAVRPLVLRGLRGIVAALAPIFCGLALIAQLVVPILFGPKWEATGPILALLAPAGFFVCVYTFVNAVLMGLGQSHRQFRLTVLGGVSMSVGALIGAHFGALGVAAGLSVGAALVAPVYLSVLSHEIYVSALVIIMEIASPIFAVLVMLFVVTASLRWIGAFDPWVQLSAIVILGVVSFSAVLAAISWRSVADDLHWLISTRHGAPTETLEGPA